MRQSAFITAISFGLLLSVAEAGEQTQITEQPYVIFDSGDSRPLSELFGGSRPSAPPDAPPPNMYGAFPVETPSMGLGRFASAPWPDTTRWRGAPLFLIGADQHSLAWMKSKRAFLKEIGAAGLLVSAASEQDLIAARAAAPDLQIIAASGEDIAKHTGLRLYPVLITRDGIEQ